MKQKKILKFPANFLWGVSTSAYQIEGGIINDWSIWEKSEGRIKKLEKAGKNGDDFICGQACDSYNKYEEDLDLVKELNCGAYRMGVEWARIEPKEGEFNMNEIEHYRRVLQAAKERNLKVVLTLWHWTNPVWLAEQGGWANKGVVDYFARYAGVVVKELGGYVDFWVTLNEPMVHIFNGHIIGKFPPNKKSLAKAIRVFNNLIKAHKRAYGAIHQQFPEAKVSITKLINYFEPARKWCLVEILLAKIAYYFWNNKFLQKIKNSLDYIAIDYYFHDRIIWRPPFKKNLNKKTTDMGWEIYPEGIYQVLKCLNKFNKPIYIMENGIADKEDGQRTEFIIDHLRYVHRAIKEGVDVRGYFYWSLLDNFEWAAGWGPKFGFYAVDKETFRRIARPSAKIYAGICKNNELHIYN